MRGLVFGFGRKRLPAYFASRGLSIAATDAPVEIGEIGEQAGWTKSLEHCSSRDQLRSPEIVSGERFDRHVSHRTCDMTAIDQDLTGFDFTWSSCCFEQIGSRQTGLRFVVDSVEQTLYDRGIAYYAIELNLSPNEGTLDHGPVVFYRERDMLALVERRASARPRARGAAVRRRDGFALSRFVRRSAAVPASPASEAVDGGARRDVGRHRRAEKRAARQARTVRRQYRSDKAAPERIRKRTRIAPEAAPPSASIHCAGTRDACLATPRALLR